MKELLLSKDLDRYAELENFETCTFLDGEVDLGAESY